MFCGILCPSVKSLLGSFNAIVSAVSTKQTVSKYKVRDVVAITAKGNQSLSSISRYNLQALIS